MRGNCGAIIAFQIRGPIQANVRVRYDFVVNGSKKCRTNLDSLGLFCIGWKRDIIVDGMLWQMMLCITVTVCSLAMSINLSSFNLANMGPVCANLGWSSKIRIILFCRLNSFTKCVLHE